MRKLLILTTLSILPAFGCADAVESLRRFEVWKLQTFCEPTQPVVSAPPCTNPCATSAPCAAPAASACGCPQGASARPTMITTPTAVSTGYGTGDDAGVVVPGSIKTSDGPALSTEELNGILKQP
jgi:hypothetical protein